MNTVHYFNQTQFSSSPKFGDHKPIQYFVEDISGHDEEDLEDEDENGNSSLIFAALNGREDLVKSLVDQGASVNHQNHNGETALYWASSQGHESIVEFLIENGSNLNIANLDGATPAHVAAANGHCNILSKLVRNGAYVNAQDEDRDSVLHYAVREGQQEVVEFLVRVCKAKVDIKNEDSETPLELAQCLEPNCMGQYENIIKILSGINNTSNSSSNGNHEEKFKNFDGFGKTNFFQQTSNLIY